jgi:hypothetical protein
LEEHRQALLLPSWKDVLNYETEWMTREDIVLSSYEASLELNRIKARHGLMSLEEIARQEARTTRAVELLEELDALGKVDGASLDELQPELAEINAIASRPRNDWELGLRLGAWGSPRKVYFLVSQGLAAIVNQSRAATSGNRPSRRSTEKTTSVSGGQE